MFIKVYDHDSYSDKFICAHYTYIYISSSMSCLFMNRIISGRRGYSKREKS